jgi:two-component system cell cycle sensor histidine kinase/response regulator CckA
VHREEAAAKSRKAGKAKQDELWGSGTILLVEDEPMVRGVAERALTRHGYTVLTADNGEEALEVIRRGEPIDLLISDVVMPGMDGPTMVEHARKERADLKVLFMSGYAEEQLRESLNVDNAQFLPKPFSVQDLAEATKRALAPK